MFEPKNSIWNQRRKAVLDFLARVYFALKRSIDRQRVSCFQEIISQRHLFSALSCSRSRSFIRCDVVPLTFYGISFFLTRSLAFPQF